MAFKLKPIPPEYQDTVSTSINEFIQEHGGSWLFKDLIKFLSKKKKFHEEFLQIHSVELYDAAAWTWWKINYE